MEQRKTVDLINWDKNNDARIITETNWEKLKADIKRRGVREALKIGADNTVYDGNNRLKAVMYWIAQDIHQADNGMTLDALPVEVYDTPTEASKWELALTGNEQFASWNKNTLSNYLSDFEDTLELSLFNIEFDDPQSFDEQLADEGEEKTPKDKTKKEIICPNCQTPFIP
jgi:hypothetical protein